MSRADIYNGMDRILQVQNHLPSYCGPLCQQDIALAYPIHSGSMSREVTIT